MDFYFALRTQRNFRIQSVAATIVAAVGGVVFPYRGVGVGGVAHYFHAGANAGDGEHRTGNDD